MRKALVNLTAAIGQAVSPVAVEALTRQMDEHARAVERLETEPVVPARWIDEPSGGPYRERWAESATWETRADLLLKAGVRFFFEGTHKSGAAHMYLPPHLLRQPGMSDEPAGATVGDEAGSPENGARRYLAELRNSKGLNPALRDRER
ncbi:hypothetical protein [Streptomyces sp. NPDC002156]